ncbi:MAG: ABC transporter ATP-binding protein, partial [Oscillospiraceae bacterium]|nr:ABC transporter ATP-binding protein [Oscillospiraceae bacterium]
MADIKKNYKKFEGTHKGPPSGPPGARGGFQKPKNTKKTIKRLLGYLFSKNWPIFVVLLCLIISTASSIGGTYLMRPIINGMIGDGTIAEKIAYLAKMLAVLFGLYVIGALASYAQSATMAYTAQKAANRIRGDLFSHLEELPLRYFDSHSHGELMSRFTNDCDHVSFAMEQTVVSLFSSVLTFVGLVAVMIYTSAPLFLVTILTLVATMMVFKVFGGKSRKLYREQQAALGRVNGDIQEIIEGLKVVKAFNHENIAREEFYELNEDYRATATDASFYSTAIMPFAANIMNVGYALTAVAAGLLAVMRGFDLGGFSIYLQYSKQIGQPMNQISMQTTAILSALAGAERIFEVMDTEPEIDEGKVTLVNAEKNEKGEVVESDKKHTGIWAWKVPGENGESTLVELKGAVKLNNVDFGYVPEKQVLKNVSVYANPGQKIAFVGSTGAGKTTITNLINRFYEIDSGSITYDGIDIRDIKKDDLRSSMGAVLQDTHLFTGTVMDNIRYGRLDATDEECIAAAKSANAHSFIRRLPDGYNTQVTGDGANLSQGQRQLLAIARAAVASPPVLVLDEATSSIDTRTERHIEQGMDMLMENRTVFVIAHRLSTVRNSNCIVVIEGGEI